MPGRFDAFALSHALLTAAVLAGCADGAPAGESAPAAVTRPDANTPAALDDAEPTAADPPAAAAVQPAEAVRDPSASAAPTLFWGMDPEDGLTYTWWVERDGEGSFVANGTTGAVLAIDGALWHWVVEEEPVVTGLHCDDLQEVPGAGEGVGIRAYLERVDGGERREVIGPRRDQAREAADWNENAVLVGSLGPYLFIDRSLYAYHCGAHGGVEHELLVWDARSREVAAVYASDELEALDQEMTEAARAALREESMGESLLFGDEVSRTLLRPVFAADGVLRMEHQWTAGTCYACSDGDWDSYTVSTQVQTQALPRALAPHATGLSEPLRWLQGEAEGVVIGGASVPDAALRSTFDQLPSQGC